MPRMETPRSNALMQLLGIELPIVQAPMAGVSTPAMAAAVSNAGALGSLGVGATNAEGAREMIAKVRALSKRSLHVNVFCHVPPKADAAREAAWIERVLPTFVALKAEPPAKLTEIYKSFLEDDEMLAMLVAERPKVVSFHFGVPAAERIAALKRAGIVLLASATNLKEARVCAAAGVDGVIAQGYEAGGHRGTFDADGEDDQLGMMALTRLLVRELELPILAAGGIMDGAGIAAALRLGASAAVLGTAFIDCAESQADAGYRAALHSEAAQHTTLVRAISGRPARCLANRFTAFGREVKVSEIPAYPIGYDLGKALNAAGKAAGEPGFGAQWAGQGAPLARAMPAAELVRTLARELESARQS